MNTPQKGGRASGLSQTKASPSVPSTPNAANLDVWKINHEQRRVKRLKLQEDAVEFREPKLRQLKPSGKRYTIKMRVSAIKMYPYDNGTKYTLKFTGLDESGEVTVTAFAPDSEVFVNCIKVGKSYEITEVHCIDDGGKYGTLANFPYTLRIYNNSMISSLCPDDLPELPFNFVESIADIKSGKFNGELVDVLVVVALNNGVMNGPWGKYRRLYLTDKSKETVLLTLGGWEADEFGDDEEFVAALRKFRVADAHGTPVLKPTDGSAIVRKCWGFPETEAQSLLEWFLGEKEALVSSQADESSQHE